jgi:aromatic ring-opening dioxygenase catalytic subunit (LigB family)
MRCCARSRVTTISAGVAARERADAEHTCRCITGARSDDEPVSIPIDGIDMGAISMLSVLIGSH